MSLAPKGRKGGRSGPLEALLELPAGGPKRSSEAFVQLRALIYVMAGESDSRMAGILLTRVVNKN